MAKWRNKINLKEYLTDEETDEQVLICVNAIIPQLENVLNKEKGSSKIEEYFLFEFEELIEEFKWIQDSINKGIEPDDYGFDSWCEAFNEYLEQLYDIGDSMIMQKDFWNDEKFLWIG